MSDPKANRMVSPERRSDDVGDTALRPQSLNDFVGQAQTQFQIAVVDRAQLDRQRAVANIGFGAGKGGHATQHRRIQGAEGAQW